MNAEEYQNRHKNRHENRYEPHSRRRDASAYETENNYVGYDYMELTADGAEISFLLDSYAQFGWEPDEYASRYRASQYGGDCGGGGRKGRIHKAHPRLKAGNKKSLLQF